MAANNREDKSEERKLWGGRFKEGTATIMNEFNASISYDKTMWREDIQGSICYTRALEKAGLLSEEEEKVITKGLEKVSEEWKSGSFKIKEDDEDIHTANERRLKELIGPLGGKVHTGRSRNDQVAVDMKMWLKGHLLVIEGHLKNLLQVILTRASKESNILMPGYTHLQRAQPIRWSHWLLSHGWALFNDLKKLKVVFDVTDVCPLGSGALAGNPFNINRESLAKDLGFSKVTQNSLLAVADRDFIAEYLFWASMTSTHLSRLAEDLIIYSTSEFSFVKLSDAYSTGSSLMPQKKNPDSLELARGKAGRITGHLLTLLTVLKGLPFTYNKDLQEDKELMFDTAHVMCGLLQVIAGTLHTLTVSEENCLEALTEDMLSTDIAYYLVKKKIPFRDAHGIAGEVVKLTEELKCKFSELKVDELKKISLMFDEDIKNIWSFTHSIDQYSATGGTSLSSVEAQIQKLSDEISLFNIKKTKEN